MKKLALLLASLALTLLAGGCGSQGSSADPPADFKVVAGDASATVTWTAEPDVDYWIFYGPGEGITSTNWSTSRGAALPNATSPFVVTGLVNGSTYSFSINGRKGGGPGGPGAPTQVVVPTLAGGNWAVGAPLGTARINGIAAGTGTGGFSTVAVGANGAIFSSVKGAATTTPANPAAPADLYAALYGPQGFVVAGANGTVLTSVDATTWTAQASGTTAALYGGAGLLTGGYVAVGEAGTILTSGTGTTWVAAASGTTNALYAATYGNNLFVVVGAGGVVLTSTDGATWQAVPSGTANDLRGVTYAALTTTTSDVTVVTNLYLAVGAAGTVLTSSDGLTWTVHAPISARDLSAVVYSGQFVAVGKAGGIYTSVDGVTWSARTSGTDKDLTAVARTLSGYTAVGDAGTNVSSF